MSASVNYYLEGDAFFNPQLQLEDSERKTKVEALLSVLRLNVSQVEALRAGLRQELAYGLEANPARPSAFPMYNTFCTKFPTGTEVGDYLGMDIGGTNLRLVYLKLRKTADGKYEKSTDVDFYEVPNEVRKSNSQKFFGFLAEGVKDFVEKRGLASLDKTIPLGFTFSFGYDQHAIDRGTTVQFGINTNIADAVGQDPVQQLQASLDSLRVPVKVTVLANDATGTLTYAKYLDQESSVGLIMGSGTNVAYIEDVGKFGPISNAAETFGEGVKQFVVNTEYCVFGDRGELDPFLTKYDKLVDEHSFVPQVYVYEKCMGGAFLGESFRYILVDLVENTLLLNGKVSTELSRQGSIVTADISLIEAEYGANGSGGGINAQVKTLLTRLGYAESEITEADSRIVTFVGQMVTTRAALMVATAVAVFVDHLAYLPVVKVGCDGSLFRKHPKMSRLVNTYLGALCPNTRASVFNAEQGSGIGVAMMAAVFSKTN